MALFQNEELVDVSTPDGRTLKLPRSVASALQGVATRQDIGQGPTPPITTPITAPPAAAMPMPTTENPPQQGEAGTFNGDMTATDVTLPPQPAPDGIVQNSPDYKLAGKALPQAYQKAQGDASKPLPKPQTTKAPAPVSPTDKLRQTGIGGALEQQTSALDELKTAVIDASNIEAAGQILIADEQAKRNTEIDKLIAKRAKDADADLRAVESKTAEYTTLRNKIAATKIDRKADHPILAAIGIALAGLGSTMKGESTNPALDIFWKAIDRKVAGQMEDLDQKGKVLGFQREEITQLRESASNRLAMNNLLVAGEAEKAAWHIEEIVSRTNSDVLKANGAKMAAEIRTRAADLTMTAAQAQMGHDQREKFQKQEMGYKYASLAENKRQHNDEMQFKREQLYNDTLKAIAAEHAKGGAEAAKAYVEQRNKVEGRGVKNIATNEYLLTNKGKAMMSEADKLEAQAEALTAKGVLDPNAQSRVQMMKDKAAILRDNARVQEAVVGRDPTQAGRIGSQYAAAQKVTDLASEIQELYDKSENGRRYFETGPGHAAIQAKTTELTMALKNAWALGVLSKQDTRLVENATGGDPTKGWDAGNVAHTLGLSLGTDPEAFKARLDSIAKGVREGTYDEIKANSNYDGKTPEELFRIKEKPTDTDVNKAVRTIEQERTPGEKTSEVENESAATTVANRVRYNVFSSSKDDRREAAENSGSWTRPALSPAQSDAVDTMLTKYRAGGKEGKQAAEQLAIQARSKRVDVAVATMQAIKETDPELYTKIRKTVPDAVEKQLSIGEQAEAAKAKMQPTIKGVTDIGGNIASNLAKREVLTKTPSIDLAKQAVIGKQDAFEELSRRAGAGDQEARSALDGVIKLRERRSPPPMKQKLSLTDRPPGGR